MPGRGGEQTDRHERRHTDMREERQVTDMLCSIAVGGEQTDRHESRQTDMRAERQT